MSQAELQRAPLADFRRDQAARRASGMRRVRHHRNIGTNERYLSIGAGVGLAAMALLRRRPSLFLAAMAGGLIYRGAKGHCQLYEALGMNTAEHRPSTVVPARTGCKLEKTITIQRSAKDLYSYWREIENLPLIMRHLQCVHPKDRQRSQWIAHGALGKDLQWEAEIFNERENEMIAWRSLPGGDVDTAGSVHFKQLPHDRGTELTVSLKYNPPMGALGAQIATLLGSGLEKRVADDLRCFKQAMEAGEVPTTHGQPTGRHGLTENSR